MSGSGFIPDELIEILTPFFCRRTEDGCGSDDVRQNDYSTSAQSTSQQTPKTSDTTVDVVLEETGWIEAHATYSIQATAGDNCLAGLYVDSTRISTIEQEGGTGYEEHSSQGCIRLAAGTYTVSIKWWADPGTGGTAYIDEKYLSVLSYPEA